EISYGGKADKAIAYIPLDSITSIPEHEADYPEFSMFGELPSWGFYIRHAEGITFKNVTLRYLEDDFRPAMVIDDAKNINLVNVHIPTAKEMPVILLNKTVGIELKDLKIPVSEREGIRKTNY
ncbi:MAG TPA: glycoside hydrolase family 28 protein, partial [Agriterribacter sp.]|nr:glycoside hydrolase family 28 protein [Agriterribacter sp.]